MLTGMGRAFCAGADMSGGDRTFESQKGMQGFSAAGVAPAALSSGLHSSSTMGVWLASLSTTWKRAVWRDWPAGAT